jgi:hypothetical protein
MARRALLLLVGLAVPACDRGSDDDGAPATAAEGGSAAAPPSGGPAARGGTTLNASLGGGQHAPDVPSFGAATATFVLFDDRIDYLYSARDLRGDVRGGIQLGELGRNGPVIFDLPSTSGTLRAGDLILRPSRGIRDFQDALAALRAGRAYVNLRTTSYPDGEIRGQIGPATLTARLRAVRHGSGTGRATFSLDGPQDRIAFALEVEDLGAPTIGAKIRIGPDGPLLFELATGPFDSPLRGTLTADDVRPSSDVVNFADAVDVLLSGDAWVLVRTTTHPDGEVRGRIGRGEDEGDDDDD